MPVQDHPVHEKVRFKEVPLSLCHSSLPDRTRPVYGKLETVFHLGVPRQVTRYIVSVFDYTCRQPDNRLPECRNCTHPEERDARACD